MPWTGAAASNGLKLSVRLSSGEDSMTSGGWLELALAFPLPVEEVLGLEEPEEQAARPAARSVTTLAVRALLPGIPLIVNFDLSSRVLRISRRSVVYWLDGAVRDLRRGYVEPPARRRPVGRQRLEGGVVLLALVHGKRAPVAERAAGGGWADVAGPSRTAPGGHVRGLEHGAQVVRVRGGGDEELGVRVRGTLGDVLGRPALDDLAAVHHQHLVGEVAGRGDVVRDVEQRQCKPGAQVIEQVEHLQPDGDVEHGYRLVGQQHGRLRGQGPGEGNPLALAAGQLVRI